MTKAKPADQLAKRGPKTRTLTFDGLEEVLVPMSKLDGIHQAASSGKCSRCEQVYRSGDWLFREDGRLVGVNCCASAHDAARPAEDAEDIEGRDFVPISQVMPPNRTKADMCRACFQIPAANGACAC